MSPDLTTQAVNAALSSDWPQAIKINRDILKDHQEDVEALNRLARAYKESGDYKQALKIYRKVLSLDRYNPIAQKNLSLLEKLPKSYKKKILNNSITINSCHCQPHMFLEEPGKTKIVNLVNLAPASNLLPLSCGDQVNLLIKRRAVIATNDGTYLGAIPDDMSIKLIKRITVGNRYEAFIKTVDHNSLAIFIREIYRASRYKNQPTFPGAGGEFYSDNKGDGYSGDEDNLSEDGQDQVSDDDSQLV
ncbi:MAG: tetratricopeptide repeat protein [Candidatus Gottesmanbacteria bacterium]